ncbi:hypothetical protein NUW58_g6411 [Xylaria curta]|uniref:Uncharacterized protein n=1 Tax=Xylaria curta TaxID=42375 RepID=A0ACC1NUI6_9PEZI|nr:hypothetical protein NUW58_g6411 [Xylaria curta]
MKTLSLIWAAACWIAAHASARYASQSVQCCAALSSNPVLHDKVYYPNSTAYAQRIADYWSVNAALKPWCMILPLTANETSQVVQVITRNQCPFGIRSGGHAVFAGSSSTDEGVTIDLGPKDSSMARHTTRIPNLPPSARAALGASVYEALEPHGVAVTGGRSAQVGVGGFLLGGGNSLFAHSYGLACSNVVNFEVVLADGSIVNANAKENSDLWLGLRGGSGNLGLATRFDMRTIEYADPSNPLIWGGGLFWPRNATDAVVDVLVRFTDRIPDDPASGSYCLFAWIPNYPFPENMAISCALDNIRNEVAPAAYDGYFAIDGAMISTLSSRTLLNRTIEGDATDGLQNVWVTGSYSNDARVVHFALEKWQTVVQQIKDEIGETDDEGISATLQLHPLTKPIATNGDGPNLLGLEKHVADGSAGIQTLLVLTAKKPENWPALERFGQQFQAEVDAYAIELGANWGWKYSNYADASENPFATYGEETVQKLRQASQKYDPRGVFQNLRNTGFKIP